MKKYQLFIGSSIGRPRKYFPFKYNSLDKAQYAMFGISNMKQKDGNYKSIVPLNKTEYLSIEVKG